MVCSTAVLAGIKSVFKFCSCARKSVVMTSMRARDAVQSESAWDIFLLFLKFGFNAWGGPVAQIGMLREELVGRRQWISSEKFNRVLAVYQALPGPEAHELCVYFGMVRRGQLGAFLAGLGFMLPGFCLIIALAWAYTVYGATVLLPLFIGVAPAVTALIVRALHRIAAHTVNTASLWLAACVAVALTLVGGHFIVVFIICAIWQALWVQHHKGAAAIFMLAGCALAYVSAGWTWHSGWPLPTSSMGSLLIEGLKAGLLSFGGAYTAIPFLQDSMVGTYPAITQQSFMDGIALTNMIPAPLVIFGTFLGYLAEGTWGAVLMTLGIFAPAFAFTMLGHRLLESVIENKMLHAFLDGIAAAVTGLLVITALTIAVQTLTGWLSVMIFAAALLAFYRVSGKWCVPVVIILSGLVGYVASMA